MAKLIINVKRESAFSKYIGMRPSFLKKGSDDPDMVRIYLDDDEFVLEASDEAYAIEISKGYHRIYAEDPNGGKKLGIGSMFRLAANVGLALTGGGSLLDAANNGINSARESQEKAAMSMSCDEFEVEDGDVVEFNCQANAKGVVKLERIA